MGLLRLFLALGVVRDHRTFFEAFFLVKGGVAVVFFYIISGFYMSLVIKEKYSKLGTGWEKKFLLSRALRLFPVYWVVLLFSIVVMPLMGSPTVFTSGLGLTGFERGLAIFSDTFIVGLDILLSGGLLHWHPGPGGLIPTWPIYPVMTGWTVAVEITFYVLAAFFIMRNRRSAIFALAIGLYLRVWFLLVNGRDLGFSRDGLGYSNLPWGYHFFGVDLIFFMFGYVAYEMYVNLNERLKRDPTFIKTIHWIVAILAAILLGMCYAFDGFQTIHDYNDHRLWAAIPFFVLLVPPLFIATKKLAFDDFLGTFSYPIYLCHVVAPDVATAFFGLPANNPWTTLVSVSTMSTALVFFIEKPMDVIRHRLTLGHAVGFDLAETAWARAAVAYIRKSALWIAVGARASALSAARAIRYDRSAPLLYIAGTTLLVFWVFDRLLSSAPGGADSYLMYLPAVASIDHLSAAQVYTELVNSYRVAHPGWFPIATLPLALWAAGASLAFVKFVQVLLIATSFVLFALLVRRLTGTLAGSVLAVVAALCAWQLRVFDDPVSGTSLVVPWSADLVFASYLGWLNWQNSKASSAWLRVAYITMALASLTGVVACGLELTLVLLAFLTLPTRVETWGLALIASVTIGASWLASAPRIPWRDAHTYLSNVFAQMMAALPTSFRSAGHLPLGHVPALYYHGTKYVDDRFINISQISFLAWLAILVCAALCFFVLQRPLHRRATGWISRAVLIGAALWIVPSFLLGSRGGSSAALAMGQAFDGVYFEYFGLALIATVMILRLRASGSTSARLVPVMVALSVVLVGYGNARADAVVDNHWFHRDEPRALIESAARDGFFEALPAGSKIAVDPSLPFANGIHNSVSDAKYMLYAYTKRHYNVVATISLSNVRRGDLWILRTSPGADIPVYLAHFAGRRGSEFLADRAFGYTLSTRASERAESDHVGVAMSVNPLGSGSRIEASRTCGAVSANYVFADDRPTVHWQNFYPEGPDGYKVASASNVWGDVLPYYPKMYAGRRATLVVDPGPCPGTYSNIQFDTTSAEPGKMRIIASDGTPVAEVKLSAKPATVWLRYDTRRGKPIRISIITQAPVANDDLDPINFRYERDKPRNVRVMVEADHIWSDSGKQRLAEWR